VKINQLLKGRLSMKLDQFLNFKRSRSLVKIVQFLKGEVAYKTRPVFKFQKDKSLVKIGYFLKRWQVAYKNKLVFAF